MPIATDMTVGGIKSGGDITVASDGTVTVTPAIKKEYLESGTDLNNVLQDGVYKINASTRIIQNFPNSLYPYGILKVERVEDIAEQIYYPDTDKVINHARCVVRRQIWNIGKSNVKYTDWFNFDNTKMFEAITTNPANLTSIEETKE